MSSELAWDNSSRALGAVAQADVDPKLEGPTCPGQPQVLPNRYTMQARIAGCPCRTVLRRAVAGVGLVSKRARCRRRGDPRLPSKYTDRAAMDHLGAVGGMMPPLGHRNGLSRKEEQRCTCGSCVVSHLRARPTRLPRSGRRSGRSDCVPSPASATLTSESI